MNSESTFNRVFQEYQVWPTNKKKSTFTLDDPGKASSRPSSAVIYDLYSDKEGEDEDLDDNYQVKEYNWGSLWMREPEYDLGKPNEALRWWSARHS